MSGNGEMTVWEWFWTQQEMGCSWAVQEQGHNCNCLLQALTPLETQLSLRWGLSCCWRPSITVWWVSWVFRGAVIQHSIPGQLQDTSISWSHQRQVQWGLNCRNKITKKHLGHVCVLALLWALCLREWRPLKILYSWEFTRIHGVLGSVVKNLIYATLCFLLCLRLAVCKSRFLKPEAEPNEKYSIRNVEGPL